MNRLVPLVTRRTRIPASFIFAAPAPLVQIEEASRWLEDAKLFACGWVGGLVVFGTLFA